MRCRVLAAGHEGLAHAPLEETLAHPEGSTAGARRLSDHGVGERLVVDVLVGDYEQRRVLDRGIIEAPAREATLELSFG